MGENNLIKFWEKLFPDSTPIIPFWKNKLSKTNYKTLKTHILECVNAIGREEKRNFVEKHAMKLAFFVAEWFKWEYQARNGRNTNAFQSIKLDNYAQTLWDTALKEYKGNYLYKVGTTTRWLNSLYILGGFPIKCERVDLARAFEKLRKSYADDDNDDYDDSGDEQIKATNQTLSLSMSNSNGSLREYYISFLKNENILPFADEDLKLNDVINFRNFLSDSSIKDNLQNLFSLRWVLNFSGDEQSSYILLTAKVCHNNDIFLDDINRWSHISYEYLERNKINLKRDNTTNHPTIQSFDICLRINNNEGQTYRLWHCMDNGYDSYVCDGAFREKNIIIDPTQRFSKIEIIAKVGDSITSLQSFNDDITKGYQQFYLKRNDSSTTWVSDGRSGYMDSSILLHDNNLWQLDEQSLNKCFPKKRMFINDEDTIYYVTKIQNILTLKNKNILTLKNKNILTLKNKKTSKNFYCKNEGITLSFKPCRNIKYVDANQCLIKHIYDEQETTIPLCGGLKWLSLYNFAINRGRESEEAKDVTNKAKIFYYDDQGNRIEWTENDAPGQGFITISAAYGNYETPQIKVYYLPAETDDFIVRRNFKAHDGYNAQTIYFNSMVSVTRGETPGYSFAQCGEDINKFIGGTNDDMVEIEIYPPTKKFLLYLNNKKIKEYTRNQLPIKIPYTLRKYFKIEQIDENGIKYIDFDDQKYDKYGIELYVIIDTEKRGIDGKIIKRPSVKSDDEHFEFYIWKNFWEDNAISPEEAKQCNFYFCELPSFNVTKLENYYTERYSEENKKFKPNSFDDKGNGFIFQSCNMPAPPHCAEFRKNGNWTFSKTDQSRKLIIGSENGQISEIECQIKCFDISSEYFVPFRVFDPLYRLLSSDESLINFYFEYCECHNNKLTNHELESLRYFSATFYFDWMLLDPGKWKELAYPDERKSLVNHLFHHLVPSWNQEDMNAYLKLKKDFRDKNHKLVGSRRNKKDQAKKEIAIRAIWADYLSWQKKTDEEKKQEIFKQKNK